MLRLVFPLVGLLSAVSLAQPTVIEDPAMGDQLMGDHVFNLQWIDSPPGVAHVTEQAKGELQLEASQQNAKGDYASATGRITRVTTKTFEFEGTVTTKVSGNNGAKACVKTGHFTFRITGARKYWRLKEMTNCEGGGLVDYVDVFFARPKSR
jgi:hypothetical protein